MRHLPVILGWAPHLALLLLLATEYQLGRSAAQTQEELEVMLDEGTPHQKAWAMHVLANRGDPTGGPLNRTYIQHAILDSDPLVADMTYMVDLCRLLQPSRQEKRLSVRFDDPDKAQDKLEDWFRRFEFYRRKVGGRPLGGSLRLKQQEVQWLLHVLDGGELDEEEVISYLERRQAGTNSARMHRLAPNRKRDKDEKGSTGLVPGH
jgi:hypothetical protein